jgi:uncharacterized protein
MHMELRREAMSDQISRREFVKGAMAAAVAAGSASLAAPAELKTRQPFEEFEYGAVRLTGGPLKLHYDRIQAAYLALDNDRLLKVYRERAGLPAPGAPMGGWYDADGFVPGHSLGQYISGLARFARATGDHNCRSKVAELVDGFAATLGPGNRIFAGPNAERVWPCYILDKHLAGLIDAYRLTGLTQARELLGRVYQGAQPFIPESGRDRIGKKDPPYDETYVLPNTLFTAHEITGDRTMHDRARAYLLDREFFDPLARGEDVLPGRHAYSHAIALSSAAKAHLVLGDQKYLLAMENAWKFLAETQQYSTGGWGPNETFITPHKGELFLSLSSTVDHFETPCGSYAAIKLARYLLCATADGRYGDGLERVLYNTILAVRNPDNDGDYPYYSTYSANARKVYYSKKWPCCSGTLVESVADYVKNIFFKTADGVAVNLYVPSEVRWTQGGNEATLKQETGFPFTDTTTLRFETAGPTAFTLRLRIPAWLDGPASIRLNGRLVAAETRRGFAILHRNWEPGDTITLTFPQSFRTEPIDELHPETAAILRGPLVYVESSPAGDKSIMPSLGNLTPSGQDDGVFLARSAGHDRIYAPFHSVGNQSYTTYFLML